MSLYVLLVKRALSPHLAFDRVITYDTLRTNAALLLPGINK